MSNVTSPNQESGGFLVGLGEDGSTELAIVHRIAPSDRCAPTP